MKLSELIDALANISDNYGPNIEVRFEHKQTLHKKNVEEIVVFDFEGQEVLVI